MLARARGFQQLTSLMVMSDAETEAPPTRVMQLDHLETLNLYNSIFKWDLADLSGTPRLKNLLCPFNCDLTGDLSSLQRLPLSQTLVQFDVLNCERVTGDLHTLASFPRLEILNVYSTRVTGDVRNIGLTDFQCLKKIRLGEHAYGWKHNQSHCRHP